MTSKPNRTIWPAIFIMLIASALFVSASAQATERADLVRVVKSKSRLYLERDGEVFASFHAKFGAQPKGHKQQQGDEKTPEGKYFLTYKNSNSAFYLSIAVSYPNAEDKERARQLGVDPGGDIMIHGQPNGYGWIAPVSRFFNWTDGCIGLSNADMDKVWAAVEPGTPIIIEP
jgi:murein L,D-transpeptidase YafK